MDRTGRLHRLYAVAMIAIAIEVIAGLLWLRVRRQDLES